MDGVYVLDLCAEAAEAVDDLAAALTEEVAEAARVVWSMRWVVLLTVAARGVAWLAGQAFGMARAAWANGGALARRREGNVTWLYPEAVRRQP